MNEFNKFNPNTAGQNKTSRDEEMEVKGVDAIEALKALIHESRKIHLRNCNQRDEIQKLIEQLEAAKVREGEAMETIRQLITDKKS